MTDGKWGQDPFGGNPFGGGAYYGGGAPGGPPPIFTAPSAHRPPGGGEANTLATLSVIFAFLFAPAGAVLGHLGLRQIARTGQRGRDRALIGITVSYAVVVLAIVGLVAWTVLGGTDPDVTAGQGSSTAAGAPTTTKRATTPLPPGFPVDPPTLNPGRTLSADDLPGVPLGVGEIKAQMEKGKDAQSVPGLAAKAPVTELEPSPGAQGSMDPAECAPAMIAGSEEGYRDSGFRAIYTLTTSAPGTAGEQSVTQSVLAFPDPAAAQRALLAVLQRISSCAQYQPNGKASAGYFTFTEPDGGAEGDWGLTTSSLKPTGYLNYFYTFDNQRFAPKTAPQGLYYVNRRTVAQKGNAVVDISVRGLGIYGQYFDITSEVLKKLT